LHSLTKIGQYKLKKKKAWSEESRFLLRHSYGRVSIWHKKTYKLALIHLALYYQFMLVVVVLWCGDI